MTYPMPYSFDNGDVHFVDDRGMAAWRDRLKRLPLLEIRPIGHSRAGRVMYGFKVGHGAKVATITAGAHADEPAGPLTAMGLLEWLGQDNDHAEKWRDMYTWLICPQVNPDGAEVNRHWFAAVPDFERYLDGVVRELPGDDIEFGYAGGGQGPLRPENEAVSSFFSLAAPADFHVSLHSMAFASGAWFLLGGGSITNSYLQQLLADAACHAGFGLHDVQRNGEKGFRRLGRGFCTTPDSRAMARFFAERGDDAMAARFRFSSMEWTLDRNPAASILVTELPMFALEGGYGAPGKGETSGADPDFLTAPPPEPGTTAYEKFRDSLKSLMAHGDRVAALHLAKDYALRPVPFSAQCSLMMESVRITAGL